MYVRKYNRCLCQASKWTSGLVTLNFDLLTPKFIVSCPFHISHLCQFAAKLIHLFSRYYVDKFDDRRTNKRTTLCVVTVQLGWGMKTATSYHDSVLPIRLRLVILPHFQTVLLLKLFFHSVYRPVWVPGTVVIEPAQCVSWPDGIKGVMNQG